MNDILEQLQKLNDEGWCINLINDDNGYWAFGTDGVQNVRLLQSDDLETVTFIEGKMFADTINEAWKLFLIEHDLKGE